MYITELTLSQSNIFVCQTKHIMFLDPSGSEAICLCCIYVNIRTGPKFIELFYAILIFKSC